MLMLCRKLFLLGAFWFAADFLAAAQPNFLVIVTDDQRPDTIGALGNPRIETPNLDWLVKHGQSWSIWMEEWKLIYYPKLDRTQLFNLADDPAELNDLAESPVRKARLDRMRRSLNQWFHDQGDPQFLQ